MEWKFRSDLPIYSQLVEQIKLGIVSGRLLPGERLASVRDMAAEAGVHRLLLSHISARYREPEVLYEQAAAEFKNCLVATDGMRVEINRDPFTTAVQLPDNEPSEQ